MIFDPMYFVFLAPAILFSLWAAAKSKSAFARYGRIANRAGLTGAEAATAMLRSQGIEVVGSAQEAQRRENAVAIEGVKGFLTDHYDPRSRVLRLSPPICGTPSILAVGVACHEAGHALQHARNYAPLALRSALVPTLSFGSGLAFPLIFIGLIFASLEPLLWIGIAVYALIVVFQLVTLPVEFNASRRAKAALAELNITRGREEEQGVARALDAAALTYVAATVTAVLTLLYYVWLAQSRR